MAVASCRLCPGAPTTKDGSLVVVVVVAADFRGGGRPAHVASGRFVAVTVRTTETRSKATVGMRQDIFVEQATEERERERDVRVFLLQDGLVGSQ